MIERAVVLLAKKGLQGASFSQILEESGAPRGSLYHHFPGGKNELVAEAISLAGEQAIAVLDRLAGQPATDIAATFIGLWRLVLTRSDFSAGCAVMAVTVAADAPELRERTAAVFRRWQARLGALLEEGGVARGKGMALATTLISSCEGAVVI
jgi:AcrR family transcriptional regulator